MQDETKHRGFEGHTQFQQNRIFYRIFTAFSTFSTFFANSGDRIPPPPATEVAPSSMQQAPVPHLKRLRTGCAPPPPPPTLPCTVKVLPLADSSLPVAHKYLLTEPTPDRTHQRHTRMSDPKKELHRFHEMHSE